MERVFRALVPALLAVVLAGCGGPPPEPVDPTGASASASAVTTTGPVAAPTSLAVETAPPPLPEGNGTGSGNGKPQGQGNAQGNGEPQGQGNGNGQGNSSPPPSVDFPVAPIGGGDGGSEESPRCVTAKYLGEPLPPGYEVHIKGSPQLTGNKAENGDPYFVVGGSGCGGLERCGSGIVWTAENADVQCSVQLRYGGGTVPVGGDAVVKLSLAGSLICPKGQEQACKRYVENEEKTEQTIDVTPPTADETTTTSETSPVTPPT